MCQWCPSGPYCYNKSTIVTVSIGLFARRATSRRSNLEKRGVRQERTSPCALKLIDQTLVPGRIILGVVGMRDAADNDSGCVDLGAKHGCVCE